MKKLLLGAVALTLAFTSCKKEDSNTSSSSSGGTLTIGSTTYTYGGTNTEFKREGNKMTISGMNGTTAAGGIGFFFRDSTAPAAGTYRIISSDTFSLDLQANQVIFLASTATGLNSRFYESTGAGAVDLTIALNNGKYTFKMTNAPAFSAGISPTDTLTTLVSMNVTQK